MENLINEKALLAVLMYSVIGLVILSLSFKVFDRLTPGLLWKEICERQNIALAILTGAMVLAMSNIIAAAIHG